MQKPFGFSKDERIKSKKATDQLFKEGKKFNVPGYKIQFLIEEDISNARRLSALRFGVGISSRTFKKAVDRNRVKRLTREAWRLNKSGLNEMLKKQNIQMNVFFICTSKEVPDYKSVLENVKQALNKLLEKIK